LRCGGAHAIWSGSAAAQCGKASPFREALKHISPFDEAEPRRTEGSERPLTGKPQAFRTVLRQSRVEHSRKLLDEF